MTHGVKNGLLQSVVLQFRGVTAARGGQVIVRDLALSVASGEFVALVGKNGSGKTTLLELACGSLAPSAGEIHLKGKNLSDTSQKEWATKAAIVRGPALFAFDHTVREIVSMGRVPFQSGWLRPSDADEKIVDDVLREWDLSSLSERSVRQLSSGEARRVQLATAMAQRVSLVLLDEPSSSLDLSQSRKFHKRMRSACDVGMTAIMATHDILSARTYCTRTLILENTRIVEDGDPRTLLLDERLATWFA